MRGEKVVVRALRGQPLLRRIWAASERAVFVCSEENYRLLASGREGLWPVGFPRQDVFRFDPTLVQVSGGKVKADQTLWERLTRWSEQ